MRTIPLLNCMAVLAVGCAGEAPPAISPRPEGKAPIVSYDQLEKRVGQRVTTRAWVLGEGESYKIDERFYNLLVPEPQIEWGKLVEDLSAAEVLAAHLAGRESDRADADDVNEYSRLEQAVRNWSTKVREEEARSQVTCWGKFRRNILTAEYSAVPDAPSVLVNPSRGDLYKATQALLGRIGQLVASAEVEVSGKVVQTSAWAKGPGVPEGDALAAITNRPLLIEVDTIKILRTGKDVGDADKGAGAARLAEPKVD